MFMESWSSWFELFQAFTGLGFAVILTLFFHSVADLGVITWSAQATYLLFGRLQEIPDNFFYTKCDFYHKKCVLYNF